MNVQAEDLVRLASIATVSPSARLLAVVIAAREVDGLARATVGELGDAIGVERRQAFRLLAELETAGVVRVHRGRDGLSPAPSAYQLVRPPTE